ncbi:PKD-like family lipoprotein [Alistipes sp.]|uniref:PKD-like family lipoprotein n=1 Tax=Alistipes sp. TaxID=1872444 RepID=UPI003AF0238A
MKKIRIPILLCFALAALAGCYEDKTTYAANPIDPVELHSDEEQQTLRVGYLEPFDMAPRITKGGREDDPDLSYEWAINTIPGKTEFEVIGQEKELHTVLTNPIASSYYTLKLTVSDKAHDDLQYIFTWKVYVQSAFLDGLLVCDTQDGKTSDFSLIMNRRLTTNYDKEEKIMRHFLSQAGHPYPGLVESLAVSTYGNYGSTNIINQLWAIDRDGRAVYYDCKDYSMVSMEEIFTYIPAGMKVYQVFKTNQNFMASCSNGIYVITPGSTKELGWPNSVASSYPINNRAVASYSREDLVSGCASWFCKEKAELVSFNGQFSSQQYTTYHSDEPLEGKSAVAAGMTTDHETPAILMKDDASGEYAIYILQRYVAEQGYWDATYENWTQTAPEIPAAVRTIHPIPATGKALLDRAVGIAFCCTENILYVATTEGVHVINFAGAQVTVSDSKFSPDAETVTGIKLYQQGQYVYNLRLVYNPGGTTKCPLLDLTNRALIVTTQKSDAEGFVYVLPMTQIGTGNLDVASAMRYDGFGKILAVSTTIL